MTTTGGCVVPIVSWDEVIVTMITSRVSVVLVSRFLALPDCVGEGVKPTRPAELVSLKLDISFVDDRKPSEG